jgi:predicted phosphodiesterase
MNSQRRQLTIVHMTDLHFGENHRFDPDRAPDGTLASRVGVPKLYESILKDLGSRSTQDGACFSGAAAGSADANKVRTIFALAGDFTQTGVRKEFIEAEEMIDRFLKQKVFGWELRPQDIYMVPGNHDLEYAESLTEVRWTEYCRFYERHTDSVAAATATAAPRFRSEHPENLSRLINQADDGLIVAEVNSSAYVQKGTADEVRGQIDGYVVPNLRKELEAIDSKLRSQAIKIALIHHHPVVLPQLAEANRGYDGILNVSPLLNFLKNNDFFLLMHGHKHNPCVFTYDPENAWQLTESCRYSLSPAAQPAVQDCHPRTTIPTLTTSLT